MSVIHPTLPEIENTLVPSLQEKTRSSFFLNTDDQTLEENKRQLRRSSVLIRVEGVEIAPPPTICTTTNIEASLYKSEMDGPVSDKIMLNSRLLIGSGRDGLIYRFGSANISNLSKSDVKTATEWGGYVAKVPRFIVPDLPQHYVNALVGGFSNQPRVVERVQQAMAANLAAEKRIILSLWKFISEYYLKTIGFPAKACKPESWAPVRPPSTADIAGAIEDDGKTILLNTSVPLSRCHLMPEALMDGFQALVHHFTEKLFLNFLRDVLYQLQWLEKKRIVHGDLKLSNILLFVYQNNRYVFVLADFWDAFSLNSEGVVEQLDPKRDHPDYNARKLQRWKFHYEKFGTRIYKDPELLDSLRETIKVMKDNTDSAKSRKNWNVLKLDAGPINMWSFVMMLVFLLGRKSKALAFKNKVRHEILYSGSADRNPMPAKKAIELIRESALQMNLKSNPKQQIMGVHGIAKRIMDANTSPANSTQTKLSDEVRDQLTWMIGPSSKRPTAAQVVHALNLYDSSRSPTISRNIQADLGVCSNNPSCRVCHYNSR